VHSYYIPNYTRTAVLISALQRIGTIQLHQARNTARGLLRYCQTLWRLLVIRLFNDPDLYILGFRGQEYYWAVRLLSAGRPLVLDHLMSPYDSLVNEHKNLRAGGLVTRLVFLYERATLHASQLILADTELHSRFFQSTFGVPPGKLVVVPVGADETIFNPAVVPAVPVPALRPFEILFYGSFVPLHGVDTILHAAALLRDLPLHFTFVGGWKADLPRFLQTIKELDLGACTHLPWVDPLSLPRLIAASDLGLGGPFGDTGQARRVITGKTFQFLAMAKPVVVGSIAAECGFIDRINSLVVPQGSAAALAGAIRWAFENQRTLSEIGRQGYALYRSRYSVDRIAGILSQSVLC